MMRPRLAETLRRRRFDVDEVTRMAAAGVFTDEQRLELLAGELIQMPTPGPRHAGTVNALAKLFFARLEPGPRGYGSEQICAGSQRLGIPEDGEVTVTELLGS